MCHLKKIVFIIIFVSYNFSGNQMSTHRPCPQKTYVKKGKGENNIIIHFLKITFLLLILSVNLFFQPTVNVDITVGILAIHFVKLKFVTIFKIVLMD